MFGLGTVINVFAIVAGGIFGHFFGRYLTGRYQETLNVSCGICVLFLGIAGALEKMFQLSDGGITSGRSLLIVTCISIGALLGEMLNIDGMFQNFGKWLKIKTGNAKDPQFVDGFVTASLTVCIGAMGVVGAIQDGMLGDYSVLVTKAILDFVIIMLMTCSLGKGCAFSAIPVAIYQGLITLLAKGIKPIMTPEALDNLSLIGSILIFCVGLNLVFGKKVRVANLLPSIILAAVAAFLPFQL